MNYNNEWIWFSFLETLINKSTFKQWNNNDNKLSKIKNKYSIVPALKLSTFNKNLKYFFNYGNFINDISANGF